MSIQRIAALIALASALFALPALRDAAPAPAVTADGHFGTLPPGAVLPSGEECTARVRRDGWEPRPENFDANRTPGIGGVRIDGASDGFNARYAGRIDGNFAGTTDELIQWAACKWGFDENSVRAQAVQESYWRQDGVGDWDGREYLSYGLLQVKKSVHVGTYPVSASSTAFNLDYALAWRRACYEGDFTWLNHAGKRGGYAAGDEWGCMGAWFSGDWYDGGAQDYLGKVRSHFDARIWEMPGF